MANKIRGFTIIELMLVVSLVGIIAAFAVPSFANLIANGRIASTSNDLVGLLNYARSEAVKSGVPVLVLPINGTSWSGGVHVGYDTNSDGDIDSELRRLGEVPASVTISSTSNLAFTGGGLLPAGAASVTIDICDNRTGESGTEITITLGGRIRAGEQTCT